MKFKVVIQAFAKIEKNAYRKKMLVNKVKESVPFFAYFWKFMRDRKL